jgi:hypothetical protein
MVILLFSTCISRKLAQGTRRAILVDVPSKSMTHTQVHISAVRYLCPNSLLEDRALAATCLD